ncbi:uncharacterized protein LOC122230731 isoform X2 [Panthera tigris]|uniref:uncharacterized protein LOC122230731 isoform X2 n=1 Tax=Panthera tigris TaxID=9694 RepID=UPI001C6F7411|nr:uncharacterized protein LOC122230731 isoform X2 [Panthera tigris]
MKVSFYLRSQRRSCWCGSYIYVSSPVSSLQMKHHNLGYASKEYRTRVSSNTRRLDINRQKQNQTKNKRQKEPINKPKTKDYQEHHAQNDSKQCSKTVLVARPGGHTGTLLRSPQNPLHIPATFFVGLPLGYWSHLQLEGWRFQEFTSLKVTRSWPLTS